MKKFSLLLSLLIAITPAFATPNQAMVVTAQHYATKVGANILKQGGNAIDAAVAIGYALAVVHPCCGNIGGGGFMLIHLASGQNKFINFREKAPANISPKLFLDKKGNVVKSRLTGGHLGGKLSRAYLSVGVPGTVMGLNTALKEYGTMPLKRVLKPAILLAEKGYRLSEQGSKIFSRSKNSLAASGNVAKIFLKNGDPYKTNDIVIQKNLAATLTQIANTGSAAFYSGKIADKVVKASQKNGGIFTKEDFAHYTISQTKPITCNYRGYKIITTPPPGSGVTLCEILNIVEGYPLKQWGFHSSKSLMANIEAMRYAFYDRNHFLGDPDFISIPIKKLLSKQYAQQIRDKINLSRAGVSSKLGAVAVQPEGHNTTSYAVVDRWGNAVVVTYTINNYFGAKVMAGDTGFFLNNELDDFTIKSGVPNSFGLVQGSNNLIASNKRPLSSMTPTIILHHNKIFMLLGTPGGSTIVTQLVQVIENVIDYGMTLKQAVNAPRYHMQWLPDKVFVEKGALPAKAIAKLTKMGYKIQPGAPWGANNWGAVAAIMRDSTTGGWQGAMDQRRSAGLAQGLK